MDPIIATFLAALPTVISGVNSILGWIHGTQAALQQSAEWTKAEDDAFDAEIAKLKTDPEEYQKVQPL